MPLVSDAVMNKARLTMESAMLDTVVISGPATRTRVDLPGGGWEFVVGAGMPTITIGMIGPLSKAAVEQLIADRIEPTGMEELSVPSDEVVTHADDVYVTSARHGGTTHYEVKSVTPLGTYSVNRSIIVKAID